MLNRYRTHIAAAAVLLLVCISFLGSRFYSDVELSSPVEIEVPRGASSKHISTQLEEAGVIHSAFWFSVWVRLTGQGAAMQSGLYRFSGELDIADVANQLVRGKVALFKVTVPEGLRSDDILAILANSTGTELATWDAAFKDLLKGEEGEGRLLPETYAYQKPLKPEEVLKNMLQAQDRLFDELKVEEARRPRLRIIASIIEKETSLDRERSLVSAAIYNRLKKGMRLQMDPTVIYGLWRTDGNFSGNIRKKDLQRDTPWNSYTRNGLPPTPICHPGAASIRAAVNPADSDYLYFVANGTGGHAFAATLEEHDANVRRWIAIEREKNN